MSDSIQSISQNNYILQMPPASSYMNLSGLEYDGDKISGYAGSAFKAGDEFPQSATEVIETVTANSGAWGGSALPISAGPGIKFDMVNGTLVASNDETVIFNGNISGQLSDFTTNEPISNFNKLDVYVAFNDAGATILGGNVFTYDVSALSTQNVLSVGGTYTISNGYTCFYNLFYQITNSSAFAKTVNKRFWIQPQDAMPTTTQVSYNPTSTAEQLKNGYIYKMVGVDRIGGN